MYTSLIGRAASFARRPIPLFHERVSAGFPSPAQDFIEKTLDINELCVKRPAATFFVRVSGDSMTDAGIFPGDILVVDRSLQARHGDIVIPRNPAYSVIEFNDDNAMELFGVVTNNDGCVVCRHIQPSHADIRNSVTARGGLLH